MSESYDTASEAGSGGQAADTSGKVDAAKREAAHLKDTASAEAKDVLGSAKEEASSVLGEAKYQSKDLFAQTQRELSDQAATQQQRVAEGLRSVSEELGSMASSSDGNGLAGDIVQQVSTRLSTAASWLGDRDPGAVLTEVKRFARRKPGTFILIAVVAGAVAGRLTRALAASASDDKDASATPTAALTTSDTAPPTEAEATPPAVSDTPIYSQTAPAQSSVPGDS
ncbi:MULTISPECIES: hypothetical protein [Bacteria]